MKLLAALTLLLPAVHVAARIEYFGLRTGTQPGAQVVVKSPEYPDYYVVVESGSGVEPERFHWGDENRIVDLDGNAVLVDEFFIHISPIFLGSGIRLFEGIDKDKYDIQIDEVIPSDLTTHLRYKLTNK